jgi:hypothetical protein
LKHLRRPVLLEAPVEQQPLFPLLAKLGIPEHLSPARLIAVGKLELGCLALEHAPLGGFPPRPADPQGNYWGLSRWTAPELQLEC